MNVANESRPVSIAIIRRVKQGCETEFQTALRDFLRTSFDLHGVQGANMILPPHGTASNEFGILRTFANEGERDAFYESTLFKSWNERVRPLTEGEPMRHELTGLEAWFRSPQAPPPVWKMAVATYFGVVPVTLFLALTVGRLLGGWNLVPNNLVFNAFVVALLTWVVMPLITRALRGWLQPSQEKFRSSERVPNSPHAQT